MTPTARAHLALLAVLFATAACSARAERLAAPLSVDASAPVEASHAQRIPRQAALRVIAREGDVTGVSIDDAPVVDRLVRLGPDAALALALADHATLRVRGPATVLLAPGGAPALLLRDGVLTVDCAAPVLPTEQPALWVATRFARLEVAQRARFVLHAAPRASVLSMASGDVRVRQGDLAHDLSGDGTTCLSARARWSHPRLRGKLEGRGEAIRRLPPCARVVSEPSDARLGDELSDALASLEEAAREGQALAARHRALSASDPPAAAAEQRALALNAASAMRLTDEVRARRSVLAARTLTGPSPELSALLARAARAAP